jgi:uncharacterized protein (DUF433 family)
MASGLDWSQCPVVESIPGKVSGAWVFRGTRVPVSAIFENLEMSPIDEILENFHVTRDQVQTVLDFAARSTQNPGEHLRDGRKSFVDSVIGSASGYPITPEFLELMHANWFQ